MNPHHFSMSNRNRSHTSRLLVAWIYINDLCHYIWNQHPLGILTPNNSFLNCTDIMFVVTFFFSLLNLSTLASTRTRSLFFRIKTIFGGMTYYLVIMVVLGSLAHPTSSGLFGSSSSILLFFTNILNMSST